MRPNKLKQLWSEDKTVLNAWLHIPNSWSAEIMAHQGYDSITLDLQHGPFGFEAAVTMLQAISTTDAVPLARVPWNEPGIIMKMLDVGVYGIICPMINNRAECEQFVQACRYHPEGYRSIGPTRARVYSGADYQQHANREMLTIAMIETAEALQNVDEIVSTTGLDAVYIGPADLSITLDGTKEPDFTDPVLLDAFDRILTACQKYGVQCGVHTAAVADAHKAIELGFRLVTVKSDGALLAAAAQEVIKGVKGFKASGHADKSMY